MKIDAYKHWGEVWESNPRPSEPQSDVLTNWTNLTIFVLRCKGTLLFCFLQLI